MIPLADALNGEESDVRYATVRVNGRTQAAVDDGEMLRLLAATDVGDLLRRGPEHVAQIGTLPKAEADFASVVTTAGKIVCLGLNYLAHLQEMYGETKVPPYPALFAKYYDTVTGPYDDIPVPPEGISATIDWEVELAVVVGRTVHRASPDEARAAIAGYTVANDISMRDWQNRTDQWIAGKAWDATTPLGPFLVTPDEADAEAGLAISCEVNGVRKQTADTGDLFYGPSRALAYISTFTTLRPGDVVLTGTPGGVGMATGQQILLRPGDVVVSRIEGIGELRNTIVAEAH